MPVVNVDRRFRDKPNDKEYRNGVMAEYKAEFVKEFGDNGIITQKIVTHGNPDGRGELKDGIACIRTSMEVTIEDGLEIKKKLSKMTKAGYAKNESL